MREGTFHIVTFGCQMNVHDSEWLKETLLKRNFVEASVADAQIILINTCSVRKKPEEKVRSLLGRIKNITKNNSDVFIIICGCVAQQLGEKLFQWSGQVRLVAGTDEIVNVPDYVTELINNPFKRMARLDFTDIYRERDSLQAKNFSAMVSIMQGCDNFCSYCIVPFTRGRQKSRLKKDIITECTNKLLFGAHEITLLGQNVNAWGKDNGQVLFADLTREIAALPNLLRLKYITPHPKDMTEEDLKIFEEFPNIAPHLHLPLQSGSDKILSAMRRRYTYRCYKELIEKLVRYRPDMTFSTDIIVGFPGESEEDFNLTLKALEECGFINSFSFCYSDRPGTLASRFSGKIPSDIQHERLARYQDAQEKITEKWLKSRIGSNTVIIAECESAWQEKDANRWQGRDEHGIIVHVEMGTASPQKGALIKCKIESAKRHSLVGYAIQ